MSRPEREDPRPSWGPFDLGVDLEHLREQVLGDDLFGRAAFVDRPILERDHPVALKDGAIYERGTPEEVVTEDLLAEVFEIDAEVELTERGPRITPLRARHDDTDGTGGDAEEAKSPPADAPTVE